MKILFSYRINLCCAFFALWSFILGNILFLLCLSTQADVLIGTGITFLAFFIVLTPVSLISLAINTLLNLKDIRQHLTAIFMVLLNILLAILYLIFITSL